MARLLTSGFELNRVGTSNVEPDGRFDTGGAAASAQSSVKRTGGFAAQCSSGAGNATSFVQFPFTAVASRSYFLRAYFCFAQLPSSTIQILRIGTTVGIAIRMTSGGLLQLWDIQNAAQIGSASSGLTADSTTFYRLEFVMVLDGSGRPSSATGLLDGTQFATGSISTSSSPESLFQAGWTAAPGATRTCYVDDVALNDDQGGSQNTYPGSGGVLLLAPVSDNAVGSGWTTSGASGSNLFSNVDNEPPTGIADTTSNEGHQIRNASSNTASYDCNLNDYTTAGVPTGATINVVDPIIATAAPVSTGAKTGSVGIVSNPNIANIALTANSNQFWTGTAAGTYFTGWKWSHGTVTYAPSVTLGTDPVMRVTITGGTASRIAMVCFMGMYVDYTPSTAALAPPERLALQAMNRSTNW